MDLRMPEIIALLKMLWVYVYAYVYNNVTRKQYVQYCNRMGDARVRCIIGNYNNSTSHGKLIKTLTLLDPTQATACALLCCAGSGS